MLSTNRARVQQGFLPLASSSNIKNYWYEGTAVHPLLGKSYVSYAATTQIPVFPCIFTDAIIILIISSLHWISVSNLYGVHDI